MSMPLGLGYGAEINTPRDPWWWRVSAAIDAMFIGGSSKSSSNGHATCSTRAMSPDNRRKTLSRKPRLNGGAEGLQAVGSRWCRRHPWLGRHTFVPLLVDAVTLSIGETEAGHRLGTMHGSGWGASNAFPSFVAIVTDHCQPLSGQ